MNIIDLGPLYGPVNQDGLPIVGQSIFKETFTGEWDEEWPSNVLKPGCHDFTKIYIEDGQLMASGNMQDPAVIPAMWNYDDLQTIVSLIYGTPNKPIDPSFDLEATVDFKPDTMQKIWSPFWIERTNYGKTMFCVYYWLRTFLLFPERFELCAKEDASDQTSYEMGLQAIEYLKQSKEIYKFTSTDKVILQSTKTQVDFKEEEKFLELTKFEMGVQILRINDNNQYAVDQEASDDFNSVFTGAISQMLPIFQRANCITALYQCVAYFRENNIAPDKKYIDMAKSEHGEFSVTS